MNNTNTTFVSCNDIKARYGLSRGTILNLMRAGKFPQGVKFGRVYRWKISDILDFEAKGGNNV